MSYLEIEDGIPDFTKAVISFWFRMPLETMQDAQQKFRAENERLSGGEYPVYPRMHGIVPLMTFGPLNEGYYVKPVKGEEYTYTEDAKVYSNGVYFSIGETRTHTSWNTEYEKTSKILINPSYIGVRVGGTGEGGGDEVDQGDLIIHFQMNGKGQGKSIALEEHGRQSSFTQLLGSFVSEGFPHPPNDTAYESAFDMCLTFDVYPNGASVRTGKLKDISELALRAAGPNEAINAGLDIKVKADVWHHVLISFDFTSKASGEGLKIVDTWPDCNAGATGRPEVNRERTGSESVSDPCQMWIALDDKNYTGVNVHGQRSGVEGEPMEGLGDNGVAVDHVYAAAKAQYGVTGHLKTWGVSYLIQLTEGDTSHKIPSFSFGGEPVASSGHPFGIPCTSELMEHNRHVEMAEMQIFTGITLNTGDEENRRAFISDKGKPVSPKKAEELLNRRPVILLHKSGNWIRGNNTGSLGRDEDGKKIDSGQFEPTAVIESYRPGPSLHGPQKPGEKK